MAERRTALNFASGAWLEKPGGERGEGLPPGPRNGKMMGVMGGNQPFIKRALFTDFAFLLPFLRGKLRVQWGPFRTGKGPLSAQRALEALERALSVLERALCALKGPSERSKGPYDT